MIDLSKRIPINEAGQPELTRSDVWRGLVMKADNALPFVPAMTHCLVTERISNTVFIREIEFRGERCHERITLTPESQVLFERLDGSILGTIKNVIEEDENGLGLRFAFTLKLVGVEDGSQAEFDYAETVEKDYFKAVDATLGAIRRLKQEASDALNNYYAVVDRMDLEAFKALHTEDAVVQFANFQSTVGPEAIGGAIGYFWSTIAGMSHSIVNRWDTGRETIIEVKVDYTRKDGSHVVLPCVSILEFRGSKVANLRVHIDTAPLYEQTANAA